MGWKTVKCPEDGYVATRIGENYYRCLNPRCGHEFIYEPASETTHVNRNIDESIYGCSICGGKFHILQRPVFLCERCQKEYICSVCFEGSKICHHCQKEKQREKDKKEKNDFAFRLVLSLIALLMLLAYLSDQGYW